MNNKKVSIPIYEGLELKMTVDKGFFVAEYSEEEKQEVKEEPKFKDGYFCFASNEYAPRMIFIYRIGGVGEYTNHYANHYTNHYATNKLSYFNYLVSTKPIRLATEEEKQFLLDAMHKDGKDWDAVNKRVVNYGEPIKVGDICILWDDDKSYAIVDEVVDISFNSLLPYTTKTDGYENAIKCDSIKQYKEFIK